MGGAVLTALLQAQDRGSSRVSQIKVSVATQKSTKQLQATFGRSLRTVSFQAGHSVEAAAGADFVLLAHKPYQLHHILGQNGMAQSLAGKLVLSILAGISVNQIHEALKLHQDNDVETDPPHVVRAIPNIGARVGESLTIMCCQETEDASANLEVATWLFEQMGQVTSVPEATFGVATVLTGACYALTTVALEGMLDGAVAEGLSRFQATQVAAQCLNGLAKMLAQKMHPATVRESVSSPSGATMQGIMTLEKHAVRGAFADAIVCATHHVGAMGSRQD